MWKIPFLTISNKTITITGNVEGVLEIIQNYALNLEFNVVVGKIPKW